MATHYTWRVTHFFLILQLASSLAFGAATLGATTLGAAGFLGAPSFFLGESWIIIRFPSKTGN